MTDTIGQSTGRSRSPATRWSPRSSSDTATSQGWRTTSEAKGAAGRQGGHSAGARRRTACGGRWLEDGAQPSPWSMTTSFPGSPPSGNSASNDLGSALPIAGW